MTIEHISLLDLDNDYLKFIDKALSRCNSEAHVATELKPILDRAIADKKNLAGVSILHIKDWLIKHNVDIEKLRKLGVITNLDDFKTYQQVTLLNYDKNPNYRMLVKLLHHGLNRLLNSWQQTTMANQELVAFLDKNAIEKLVLHWADHTVPGELADVVTDNLKVAAEVATGQWINNVDAIADSAIELDNLVTEELLRNFPTYAPDDAIRQQVEHNQYEILKTRLFKNELASEVIKKIIEDVKEEILDNIQDNFYAKNPALLHAIKGLTDRLTPTRNDYADPISKKITKWMNGELDNEMGKEIERLIDKKLCKYLESDELPKTLQTEILTQAISNLLQQVKQEQLDKDKLADIKLRMHAIVFTDLYKEMLPKAVITRNILLKDVLKTTLQCWKQKQLKPEQANVIAELVNADLQQIQQELASRLYLVEQIDGLRQDNQQLRQVQAEMLDRLQKLEERLSSSPVATNSQRFFQPAASIQGDGVIYPGYQHG